MIRIFMGALASMLVSLPTSQAESLPTVSLAQKLETQTLSRIGVSTINSSARPTLDNRADERFLMCSTFKFLLVAQILKRVDDGHEKLERTVTFSKDDLLSYAPIATKALGRGSMTVQELCAAAIQYSDNTAANLLLKTQGGPTGLTAYLRSIGDTVTRLDRVEPELNTIAKDKDFDTTTPRAMAENLRKLLVGDALSVKSRGLLKDWMLTNTTGGKRLRAGIPDAWKVADKTGTCGGGSMGDVGVIYPANGSPIVVAAYVSNAQVPNEKSEAVIAELARAIAKDVNH